MKCYKPFCLSAIRALSFDLDDTLYDNVPVMDRAEQWLADEIAVRFKLSDPPGREFWAGCAASAAAEDPDCADDVTLSRIRGVLAGLTMLGVRTDGLTNQAAHLIYDFIAVRSEIRVPESSLRLLYDLHSRYRLAAISNGNSDHRLTGLGACFDCDLRPGRDGLRRKPCADLFLKCAAVFGCSPDEVLHVGDDPLTDVWGALHAGLRCVWLRGGIAGKIASCGLRVLPDVQITDLEELRCLLL